MHLPPFIGRPSFTLLLANTFKLYVRDILTAATNEINITLKCLLYILTSVRTLDDLCVIISSSDEDGY